MVGRAKGRPDEQHWAFVRVSQGANGTALFSLTASRRGEGRTRGSALAARERREDAVWLRWVPRPARGDLVGGGLVRPLRVPCWGSLASTRSNCSPATAPAYWSGVMTPTRLGEALGHGFDEHRGQVAKADSNASHAWWRSSLW